MLPAKVITKTLQLTEQLSISESKESVLGMIRDGILTKNTNSAIHSVTEVAWETQTGQKKI